jgi:hypothetical protein
MLEDIPSSYGGSLGKSFEMPSVHDYRSLCLLGNMRSRALGIWIYR